MQNKIENKDPSSFFEPRTNTDKDSAYRKGISNLFENAKGTTYEKLWNFSRFVPRQRLTMFLSKYELMKKILNVQGSIVEIGVHFGAGLFEWIQLSEILEPRNYQRQIHGFDNFEGFSSISEKDKHKNQSIHLVEGGLKADVYEELLENIKIYDYTRALGHINKHFLYKGNVLDTIPKFVKENPHSVISMLYLDVDLYEPTKVALEYLYPLIPKGGIVVFDELNCDKFPGESLAVKEILGIDNLRIERSTFDTWISYSVKE